ncbi:hypothetical protein ACFXGA_38160 [Actinosynnema sp. NPDC059335]|uniref:hypothetical protein n=1 Tax=Actinosynnema sp. NPDC059335 TaxID=3346804 RepID=UPI0036734E21
MTDRSGYHRSRGQDDEYAGAITVGTEDIGIGVTEDIGAGVTKDIGVDVHGSATVAEDAPEEGSTS